MFCSHYRTPERKAAQSRARIQRVLDRASVRDRDVAGASRGKCDKSNGNSVSGGDDGGDVGGGGGGDDDEKATEKLFDAVTPRLALTPEL